MGALDTICAIYYAGKNVMKMSLEANLQGFIHQITWKYTKKEDQLRHGGEDINSLQIRSYIFDFDDHADFDCSMIVNPKGFWNITDRWRCSTGMLSRLTWGTGTNNCSSIAGYFTILSLKQIYHLFPPANPIIKQTDFENRKKRNEGRK